MSKQSDAIAICGMACRFPGNANGPASFWDLLVSRKDAVTRVPDWRFSKDYYFHPRRGNAVDLGTSYVWSAGVIDGPTSRVWDEAENRLHAQKALLEALVTAG